MKIQNIEYHDRKYDWKLERVEFSTNPTLLVGISGAGKTQILRSILALKKIANGGSLNGVQWDATFSTKDSILYRWQGEFETQKQFLESKSDTDTEKEYKINYEKLYKNDELIIDRNSAEIKFKGNKTPKLSPNESALHLLKLEEEISPATDEIDRIMMAESAPVQGIQRIPVSLLKKYENSSLQDIQESGLPISIKLSLVYRSLPDIFKKIKDRFVEIFPEIEDIKIEPLPPDDIPVFIAEFFRESNMVFLKEKRVNNWIKQPYISSGMFKTLMYISELYLSPKGSVVLIDEFENSLGVNCIDSMTEIVLENKDLQFIITSHHPYIINNISPKHWKIVTRKGGVVKVKDAQELGIPKSRSKAFIDLINLLEDYSEGIE